MSKISQTFSNAGSFLGEVKAEWGKVTKPSRQDVINTTLVVVVTSFVFALYLWFADTVIFWAYQGVNTVIDKVGNVLSS